MPTRIHRHKTPIPPNCSRIRRMTSAALKRRGLRRRLSAFKRRQSMNWDQIQVNWMHFKDKIANNWAKLTDEDLTRICGRRNELVGRLQARYGFAKTEAEREIEAWTKAQRHAA
jgi:uncharacterized protein YjbJ (UPF0337 family)